ncbi:uncharacterized protein BJ212DRAFT_1481063 [Suillus subaureus]|uniref:F-box domain-containing protein n=1 Tax=Suillus subaureus TaxID=48587 RepID=A0A9P7JDF5_9AGAM|nr:uncharacterized protein BJ212DRAFT_1481063 [Suillus subaureus]KAG1815998.1 hypothetical protein BJ212DRAFT_1481063 [Suillus subaureus]
MHACLLIPEIVKLIFANIIVYGTDGSLAKFGDRYYQQVARRSLAALSRVCRSFKDMALDALWVKLDNLEPLFACLPRDLWTMTGDRKLLIQRPVTAADWLVFEQYAPRVRILGNTDSDLFGGIDAEFVYAMMGFCSQSLLVPNLRILYCKGCPHVLHSCIRYLLGPNLIYLLLVPPTEGFWSNVMPSVLSGLGRHSPQLEVVEFVGPYAICPQVSELALCGLTHLRKATLVLPSCGDLSWLSRLVSLQELRITFAGILPPLRSQFRTSYLDTLVVRSFSLISSANEVEGWVVPCRQLQLIPAFPGSAAAVERALHMLDNRLLFDVLEHILLDVVLDPADHIDNAFTLQTFTPLMRFSGLKAVDLSAFCMSLLDDDALGSIVKSWPRLECLYLGTKCFWRTPPKITFRGLVALLSACPNLRNLGLVFDATKVDLPTAEKLGRRVCNTNITSFHVGFSPIKQPLQVAISLSAVLPCLGEFSVESLLSRGPDRVTREAKWKEVLEHISRILTKKRE